MSQEASYPCSKCKVVKPASQFSKSNSKSNPRKLDYYCKECRKEVKKRPSVQASQKKCVEKLKTKRNAYSRAYNKSNRPYFNAKHKEYMGRKSNATPLWLTEDHSKEMQDMYWLAQDLKRVTGEQYHVDHIVPLKGKNVCGLHVPWNLQILPADLNLRKSNSFF